MLAEDHSKVSALDKIRNYCLAGGGDWAETLEEGDSARVGALLEIGYALLERREMMSGVVADAGEEGPPASTQAVSPAQRARL